MGAGSSVPTEPTAADRSSSTAKAPPSSAGPLLHSKGLDELWFNEAADSYVANAAAGIAPMQLLLLQVTACKAALGPLAVEVESARRQLEENEAAVCASVSNLGLL